MAGKTVVLAFFGDEAAADDAVEQLKRWDKADDDVKLNAIGVLVLDDKGKIKTHKLGKRSVGKGAGIGLLLAVVAPPTLPPASSVVASWAPSITRGSASARRIESGSRPSSRVARPPWASSRRPTRPMRSRRG